MRKRKGVTFPFITILTLSVWFSWGMAEYKEKQIEKVEEYKREIRVINLVNGLDLTQVQMELILRRAEESKRLREGFKTSLQNRQAKLEVLLEEIKDYVKKNKEISQETIRNVHRL